MKQVVKRAFEISQGLAGLAGKKLKSAIVELENEGVITKLEGQKIFKELHKVKAMMNESVVAPLRKIAAKARAKRPVSKKKKR
jgi:hypothetical protein